MHCQEVNPKLSAFADRELSAQEYASVEQHVAGCAACAARVDEIRTLTVRLRSAVQAQPDSIGLETRVRANLHAQSRPGFLMMWRLALGGAAAVALAVGTWAVVWKPMQRQMLAVLGVGASDHIHCTLERKSPPAGQLNRPIDPEYGDLLARVQAAAPKDFQLVESHFCRWQGRRFQHIVLGRETTKVSVIVTPRKGSESFPRMALLASMRSHGIPIYQAQFSQVQTTGFESGSNLAFVVSDMSAEENGKLMAALAPVIRDRM